MKQSDIRTGRTYTNGRHFRAVYRIGQTISGWYSLSETCVQYTSGRMKYECSLGEFAKWAKEEVKA